MVSSKLRFPNVKAAPYRPSTKNASSALGNL